MKYLKPITMIVLVLVATVLLYFIITHETQTNYIVENQTIISCETNAKKLLIPKIIDNMEITTIGVKAFNDNASIINLEISEGISEIMDDAFYNCTSLRSITLPKTLSSISPVAFSKCASLVAIDVDPENRVYESLSGILFNKGRSTLQYFPIGFQRSEYYVPYGTMTIKERAFLGSLLTKVYIPDTVTFIEAYAFADNKNMKNIVLPNNFVYLGEGAFSNNERLETITIGDNVGIGENVVGNNSFYEQYLLYGKGTYVKGQDNIWVRLDNAN